MNQDVKAKWLAALRSGEYKQGRQQLRNGSGEFCCLGVLCDISGLGKWYGEEYDGDFSIPPERVVEWAGLSSQDPWVSYPEGSEHRLTNLNDGDDFLGLDPLDFAQIADLIEEQL